MRVRVRERHHADGVFSSHFALVLAITVLTIASLAAARPAFAQTPATMISPVSGTMLPGTSVTFSWSAGTGVSQYWLWIGTSPGSLNLYDGSQAGNTSATISSLPMNGTSVYVRLFSLINGSWQYSDYSYSTAGLAVMTSPVAGTVLSGPSVTLNWAAGTGVSQYWIWAGNTPGSLNYYDGSAGLNSSATLSGLPVDGSTVYIRLFSLVGGVWFYNDYSYTSANKASMLTPNAGSSLPGTSATFTWNSGSGVTTYWLWVGSQPGTENYYDSAVSSTSANVSGLPTGGGTIYVRLFSLISGNWYYSDYTYKTALFPASLLTPVQGSALPGSSATFTWDSGAGVSQYWLWVGNAPGGSLYYDSPVSGGTATVTGLPTDATPVYVRLLSYMNGAWQSRDYTFQAAGQKAAMVSPAGGTKFTGTSTTFTWTPGAGATQYWLWIGTQPGAEDFYDSGQGTNTSVTVSGFPTDGSIYYVRLLSWINGAWQYNDYTYKAALPSTPQYSVNATNNLLVARYSVISPKDGSVFVQFGPTTTYGRSTMTLPVPQGGGKVDVYVGGMRQTTDYHMRATILYADHTTAIDQDRVFTTGTLPAGSLSTQTVTTPAGAPPPNPGIEFVNGVRTPIGMYSVFATDLDGSVIWYYDPHLSGTVNIGPIKPLTNGDFLAVINGSTLREINLAGDTIWEMSSSQLNDELAANGFSYVVAGMHHDLIPLPNGHILLLVNSNRTYTDLPGLPGDTLFLGDGIIDLDASHKPVWVWDAFNHLDVNRRPYPWALPDWMHSNGLVYMPDDGSLLLSIRHQSWIIKIDYANGTGTGNVVWRLGHGGDFNIASGNQADFQYAQHEPALISQFSSNPTLSIFDDGDYRVDNNGVQCDGVTIACYSRAIIMQLNEGTMTATTSWAYLPGVYSSALGSVQALPNGDLEADFSAIQGANPINGRLIEVTRTDTPQVVWEMDVTGQWVYRAFRMPSLYPGVQW